MSQTKPQTSFKQKILLVTLGIFLTLVFLEAALSLGGWLLTFFPEMKNRAQFDKAEIRILCIGESTTFLGGRYSYPAQLEEILNSRGEKKHFKVINKGLVSKTSADILAQLNANLDKYKPDVVVSMLGINDHKEMRKRDRFGVGFWSFLDRFKTYHLFELIGEHWKAKFGRPSQKESLASEDGKKKVDEKFLSMGADVGEVINNDVAALTSRLTQLKYRYVKDEEVLKELKDPQEIREMKEEMTLIKTKETWLLVFIGKQHRINKNYHEAERSLTQAILVFNRNFGAYAELGFLYQDQKKYDVAIMFFKKALEFQPDNIPTLVGLARSYAALGMENETRLLARRLFNNDKGNLWIYPEFGIWFKEHGYLAEAEKFFEKALAVDFRDDRIYPNLAEIYRAQGKTDKLSALERRAKSDQKKEAQFLPVTVSHYNEIADRVLSRGVKFICMQYPLREIGPLKAIFPSPRGIIFVENKTNFHNALQGSYYSDLFLDSFAGDFGHCTRTGNRLIAGNLAETILKEIAEE